MMKYINDKDICQDISRVFLNYLNRFDGEFTEHTVDEANAYDIQWGLNCVEKEIGSVIRFVGCICVKEFIGFSHDTKTPKSSLENFCFVKVPNEQESINNLWG